MASLLTAHSLTITRSVLSKPDTTVEKVVEYTYGTWRFQKGWKPTHIIDAEGVYMTDANGKKYLDFSSQLMCCNLGHKNPALIKAIVDQAQKMPYINPGYSTDLRAKASEALVKVLPEGLEKIFYSTSGTEANEAALKDRPHVPKANRRLQSHQPLH